MNLSLHIKKHLLPVVFIGAISLVLVATVYHSPMRIDENILQNIGRPTQMAQNLEGYFKRALAIRQPLRDLHLKLLTAVGYREFNGIYLAQDGLISHFVPTEDTGVHRGNTRGIQNFTNRTKIPTAALLLPTASAIYQEKLPPYGPEIQYNQRGFIEETAKTFAGTVAAVDVYPTLYGARKQSLYYRTDSDLTPQGGYLVYCVLAKRLGLVPKSEGSFHKQFVQAPYYGDLYRKWGYSGVQGDTITLYHYLPEVMNIRVRQWQWLETKNYYSLYPPEALVSGNPLDAILGGHFPRIDITNESVATGKLLIMGDRNTLSFLPFLALHYNQITYLDPVLLTDSQIAEVNLTGYTQAIFSFSLETYINSIQPSRAATTGQSISD